MTFHNVEKVIKNNLTIIPNPHAHPHTMKKAPRVIVDEWMDGWMDRRAETCKPKSRLLKQV